MAGDQGTRCADTQVSAKTCSRCKESKKFVEFGKCKASRDGLAYACKACIAVQTAARKEQNAENSRRWYQENKAHRLAVGKAWVESNRERRLAACKAYREANQEKIREGIKASIAKKPEHYLAYHRKWAREHSKARLAAVRKYQKAHPDKVAADNRKYRERHPERAKANDRTKRARRRNAEGGILAQKFSNSSNCRGTAAPHAGETCATAITLTIFSR